MVFRPPWAWEVRVGSPDPLAHSWGEAAETAASWGGVAQIWKEIAPPIVYGVCGSDGPSNGYLRHDG